MIEANAIDKLRIDGITYTVETTENSPLGCAAHGQIDSDKLTITMREMPPPCWLQTLWHELMHHISDWRLHGQALTESQIDSIATGINALLLDNPDLSMEIWQVAQTGNFTTVSLDDETEDMDFESD